MDKILNWIKLNGLKIGAVVLALLLSYTLFLFFSLRHQNQQNAQQLIDAHNEVARLSATIQENENTWSRLSQERDDQINILQQQNAEMASLIENRNEEIASLTNVIANFRPIRIIADGDHATQTQTEERVRVDFDQTHADYLRVSGHTLTNPAYAEVDMQFTRPLHLTIVSTQTEDGGWRTYATSDYADLQIGEIDASINPHVAAESISEQQDERSWEDGFAVGIFGGVGTSGRSGQLGISAGYDFGPVDVNILASGMVIPGGGDLIIGAQLEINPFDL